METKKICVYKKFGEGVALLDDEQKQNLAIFVDLFRKGHDEYEAYNAGYDDQFQLIQLSLLPNMAIVSKLIEHLNTHCFFAIGPKDQMTTWANTHICEFNKETQRIQLFAAEMQTARHANIASSADALFKDLSDEDLYRLGVPKSLLTRVRGYTDADLFDQDAEKLPSLVYEALSFILQGESLEDVMDAYGRTDDQQDEADEAAINVGDFRAIKTDADIQDMLNRPLAVWRVFLHPTQRKLVDGIFKGPVRVTGGAGTGKTVVAIHRAVHLRRLADWKPTDKLLFTTFSKNLAIDLREQIRSILKPSEFKAIEVTNIDSWVSSYFSRNIEKDGRSIIFSGSADEEKCWNSVFRDIEDDIPFADNQDFYKEEWNEVILPQNCRDLMAYMKADRRGRGVALTRSQRKNIWNVFNNMYVELELMKKIPMQTATLLVADHIMKHHPEGLYRAVVVDEVQDFGAEMLTLLRALTPDMRDGEDGRGDIPFREGDLFMVGDPRQGIYDKIANFKQCGIHIVGRSAKLRVNYRTTERIRRVAMSVAQYLPVDTTTGYKSHRYGEPVKYCVFEDVNQEVGFVINEIRRLVGMKAQVEDGNLKTGGLVDLVYKPSEICIVSRDNEDLMHWATNLDKNGLSSYRIHRTEADDGSNPGVRLSTMHRIKGLEFKVVFMVDVNHEKLPRRFNGNAEDKTSLQRHYRREAALFHVSASRAVDLLYITAVNNPSEFLEGLERVE